MKTANDIIYLLEQISEDSEETLEKSLEPLKKKLKEINDRYSAHLDKDDGSESFESARRKLNTEKHKLRAEIEAKRKSWHDKNNRTRKKSPSSIIKSIYK